MKKIVKSVFGKKIYEILINFYLKISNNILLNRNYYFDKRLYKKYSRVFKNNTVQNIESIVIMSYHSIEKGFLFDNIKYKFATPKVERLIYFLQKPNIIEKSADSQFQAAYISLVKYYEIHEIAKVDISGFFPNETYQLFKSLILEDFKVETGILNHTKESFFKDSKESFLHFSKSRKSVRDFSVEKIPMDTIYKVIELSRYAPSVCNRQASKVYYTENRKKIDSIFEIQGGFKGYSQNVNQLLFITVDRSYFYTVGERNQFYVDGGIFLMNLMYSLHYYGVVACPANWGMTFEKDIEASKMFNIPESEKVICLLPIGLPKDSFKTTLSLRRDVNELIKIV